MKSPSARCLVLMYHRIEEPDTDPWNLCVSPQYFEEQVNLIKQQQLPVISTGELVQQLKAGGIAKNCVCLTFDDGYADNFINALPVLTKYHCPATFFIAAAFTNTPHPYWWDELELICLHAKRLPPALELRIGNEWFNFSFETELTEEEWQQHATWKWYETPLTQRCGSFLQLWTILRPLALYHIHKKMEMIRNWAGTHFRLRMPMDDKQLRCLSQNAMATVGLHTHTHMDLKGKSAFEQAADIRKGDEILSVYCDAHARRLAYPYGRFDATTMSVVDELGLDGAFTTEPLPVAAGDSYKKIGRYGVGNWNAQQFEEQLTTWFSGG